MKKTLDLDTRDDVLKELRTHRDLLMAQSLELRRGGKEVLPKAVVLGQDAWAMLGIDPHLMPARVELLRRVVETQHPDGIAFVYDGYVTAFARREEDPCPHCNGQGCEGCRFTGGRRAATASKPSMSC